MSLGLSESLRTLVRRKFVQARTSQDIIFSDTQLTVLHSTNGIPFQLRYCPALNKKPKNDKPDDPEETTAKLKFDPFENPSDDLLVARIPSKSPSHVLVLNKFPVIENHFILATQSNKPQRALLEPDDLSFTYACLQAWEAEIVNEGVDTKQTTLFAFFNSGEHSGASQPHRHLQFLPVEDIRGDQARDWEILTSGMTVPTKDDPSLLHDPRMPITHFAMPLNPSISPQDLHKKYTRLMHAAHSVVLGSASLAEENNDGVSRDGHTTFSYNLAMTTRTFAILPRKNEAATLVGLPDSEIALNGTILAGTLMVKLQSEWDRLRERPELMDDVLVRIGFRAAQDRVEPQRL